MSKTITLQQIALIFDCDKNFFVQIILNRTKTII